MKAQSARTLAWTAFILLLVAGMIGAPVAALMSSAVSGLCALAAIIFGSNRVRIVALLLLLAALAMVQVLYSDASKEMGDYRNHAGKTATAPNR